MNNVENKNSHRGIDAPSMGKWIIAPVASAAGE